MFLSGEGRRGRRKGVREGMGHALHLARDTLKSPCRAEAYRTVSWHVSDDRRCSGPTRQAMDTTLDCTTLMFSYENCVCDPGRSPPRLMTPSLLSLSPPCVIPCSTLVFRGSPFVYLGSKIDSEGVQSPGTGSLAQPMSFSWLPRWIIENARG